MKKYLKKIIPNFTLIYYREVRRRIDVIKMGLYDLGRFYKYSAAVRGDLSDRNTLISSIIMDYHRIEKGLSLERPRPMFGLWFIPDLIDRILLYHSNFGCDKPVIHAANALESYIRFHEENNVPIDELNIELEKLEKIRALSNGSGVNRVTDKKTVHEYFSFDEFVKSRHSIRDFKPGIIEDEIFEEAVSIAKYTPSVCNRQPWGVYIVKGDKVNKVLQYQNGNKAFRDAIHNVIIVTGKLSFMRNPIERHQIYIDGGMFSMSLIYALHSLNLGVCPLNWCVTKEKDLAVRKVVNIPNDEEIIMYLAVGYKKDTYNVAASPRIDTSDIIICSN